VVFFDRNNLDDLHIVTGSVVDDGRFVGDGSSVGVDAPDSVGVSVDRHPRFSS